MSGRQATGTDTELLALQSKMTPGLVCDRQRGPSPGVGAAGVQGRVAAGRGCPVQEARGRGRRPRFSRL